MSASVTITREGYDGLIAKKLELEELKYYLSENANFTISFNKPKRDFDTIFLVYNETEALREMKALASTLNDENTMLKNKVEKQDREYEALGAINKVLKNQSEGYRGLLRMDHFFEEANENNARSRQDHMDSLGKELGNALDSNSLKDTQIDELMNKNRTQRNALIGISCMGAVSILMTISGWW